jgi:hypothetical protein
MASAGHYGSSSGNSRRFAVKGYLLAGVAICAVAFAMNAGWLPKPGSLVSAEKAPAVDAVQATPVETPPAEAPAQAAPPEPVASAAPAPEPAAEPAAKPAPAKETHAAGHASGHPAKHHKK